MGTQLTHEQFLERCKLRDDYNEYEVLGKYINSRSKIKFKHKICDKEFDMKANNFTSNKQKCPHCNPTKKERLTQEQFEERIKELVGEKYIFLEKYKNNSTPLKVIHNEDYCGKEYKVRPADFFNGYRCPHCSKRFKLVKENVPKRVEEINDEYEFHSFINDVDFEGVHTNIMIRHKKCGSIFKKSINNLRNGQGCLFCSSLDNDSKAVKEIKSILDENNIVYRTEVTFDDLRNPKTNRRLRIDFYLEDLDLYIEYDGKQHFIETNFFTSSIEEIRYRDNIKNKYFKDKNLKLIRINYNQDHKKLIKQILNSTTI